MGNRPKFNVISEPWIPVGKMTGETAVMGIRDVLLHAHELYGVNIASPLLAYGVQRILIAFLIDAFRPEDIDELSALIGRGRFDGETIDAYIALCREGGECFDLFDEKRPFLQSVFEGDTGQQDYIVKLFAEWPEGNNHVHFNHVREDSHLFTPAECAQALCALPAFAMNYGRSKYFGINGAPPIYFLHAGKDLFETLVCSMVTQSEYAGMSFDNPPIAWRSSTPVPAGAPVERVSLLHGLTAQPRRIQLIPEQTAKGILLRYMKYDKGWNYETVSNWRDPHVAYYLDNKGVKKMLRPREGRAVWRDLGSILPKNSQPMLLNRLDEKLALRPDVSDFASLHSYVLVGKFKGVIYASLGWFEEPIPNYLYLFKSEIKTEFLLKCLNLMENINSVLRKTFMQSLKQLQGEKDSIKARGRYAQLTEQVQTLFLASSREYVMGDLQLMLQEAQTNVDWEIPIKIKVGERFLRMALKSFEEICAGLSNTAKTLEWRAIAENVLKARINGCLKGGWSGEGEKKGGRKKG